MPTSEPPSLRTRRDEVGDRLAAASGLLCCLDFDGTLAPIVDDPDAASMSTEAREILPRLAARSAVTVAIVSGRSLEDLRDRVAVDGVRYAGNHGLEVERDGQVVVHPEAQRHLDAIDGICDDLADRLSDVPGSEIEHKRLTATVHVRNVPDDRVDEVERAVASAVDEAEADLVVSGGKEIFEIRPPVDWDKGRAVELLADEAPDDWLALYVGDDLTDEDAFEALDDGLGVLVGDRADTAADYRLPEQADVGDFLAFVDERLGAGG